MPSSTTSLKRPGRLGDPTMGLKTDPRVSARLLLVLKSLGMDERNAPVDYTAQSSPSEIDAVIADEEVKAESFYDTYPTALPTDVHEPEVKHTRETIPGPDGHALVLHIFTPAAATQPLPCIYYTHGGGMVITRTDNPVHRRWSTSLALQGCVVVMPDFRNAYTAHGHNPFPTGLRDCAAGLQWVAAHAQSLGVGKIITQGESGGANLALALALTAKAAGWLHCIAGVYAYDPYISGVAYGWDEAEKLAQLPSLVECDGYVSSVRTMELSAPIYGPTGGEAGVARDAQAWPYWASESELQGLPPHMLSMDELDPLRDEGVAYCRKLQAAGVVVTGKVNLGFTHASAFMFRRDLPEVHAAEVRAVVGFARSL